MARRRLEGRRDSDHLRIRQAIELLKGREPGVVVGDEACVRDHPFRIARHQSADDDSDGRNGASIDDKFGAVNRGGAIGGQVSDEVGNLMRFGRPPDGDPTQAVEDELPRLLERAAIAFLQTLEQVHR